MRLPVLVSYSAAKTRVLQVPAPVVSVLGAPQAPLENLAIQREASVARVIRAVVGLETLIGLLRRICQETLPVRALVATAGSQALVEKSRTTGRAGAAYVAYAAIGIAAL